MANELDTPDFGNFSIQSTIEGAGSQELLNDLLAPETSTGNPDDIKKLEDEPAKPAPAAAPAAKADKADKADEPIDPAKGLNSFLYDDEEDDKDGDDDEKEKPLSLETKTEEEDPDAGNDVNQFTALSKDLFKLGVFTPGEDDEETPIESAEQFLERFNVEKKRGAAQILEDFIGQFGEEYQNAFQAIYVKGVSPKDYFGTYNAIESYADMDLTNESNQVAVMKQALTDQGLDPEDIDAEIERLKNYADLEAAATRHHKALVKKEATKLQQLEQTRERELAKQMADKQQYVQNVNTVLQEKVKAKEFDGIPLNPKLAQELQDFLVTDKWKTSSGETLTDFDRTILELKRPENHQMKVKVALLLKILEKDPTLSTIQKTGVTKKTDALFGEVARQSNKSAAKTKTSSQPSSWWTS